MANSLQVLTTRPIAMAARLSQPLQAAGFTAVNLPLFTIQPLKLNPAAKSQLLNLDNYAKVFVLSPSAAEIFIEEAENYWPQWPLGIQWFTVGKGSHDFLAKAGIQANYPPPATGDTSEALLQLALLSWVEGEKILLVKGEGGRDVLFNELTSRGGKVENLKLYKRQPAQLSPDQLQQLLAPKYLASIITSGEALNIFYQHSQSFFNAKPFTVQSFTDKPSEHTNFLTTTQLLLPSQRLVEQAKNLGFSQAINTNGAGAEALIASLKQLTA